MAEYWTLLSELGIDLRGKRAGIEKLKYFVMSETFLIFAPLINYFMISKDYSQAPSVDAIPFIGVIDKPSMRGALIITEPEIKLTQDHVIPLSKKGNHTYDNIQPLCGICNSSKATKVIDYRP